MTHLRLTHADLGFGIDVRLREFDGRWLAVADLADEPDVGVGETAEAALRQALASLGSPLREALVAGAGTGLAGQDADEIEVSGGSKEEAWRTMAELPAARGEGRLLR